MVKAAPPGASISAEKLQQLKAAKDDPLTLYEYDVDGNFIGQTKARLSPADADLGEIVWLIPRFATDRKPPDITATEQVIFVDGDWQVQQKPIVTQPPTLPFTPPPSLATQLDALSTRIRAIEAQLGMVTPK